MLTQRTLAMYKPTVIILENAITGNQVTQLILKQANLHIMPVLSYVLNDDDYYYYNYFYLAVVKS